MKSFVFLAAFIAVTSAASRLFFVTPDLRKCASPMCGGYWISNPGGTLKCRGNAKRQEACYVSEMQINIEGVDYYSVPIAGAFVNATLGRKKYGGTIGTYQIAKVSHIYVPGDENSEQSKGRHFELRDTGVECVTTPCFKFLAKPINRNIRPKQISDLAPPSDKKWEEARRALDNGLPVLVQAKTGKTKPQESGKRGKKLRILNFWHPFPACGPNEVFDSCGTSCPSVCGQKDPEFCTDDCNVGCRCARGFVLSAEREGTCISEKECASRQE